MGFTNIFILTAAASLMMWISRERPRQWIIFISSILTIYWMQSPVPIRNMDFWFPTLSLGICGLVWGIVVRKHPEKLKASLFEGLALVGLILIIGALRYIDPICCLTPTRPPVILQVAAVPFSLLLISFLIHRYLSKYLWAGSVMIGLLLLFFVLLKTPTLAVISSAGLRLMMGQTPALATAADLRWLGYSYIAFRLIHILHDHQMGRLPALSLMELVNYVIFFPTLAAGPIDRVERFQKDLRQPPTGRKELAVEGFSRIFWGIFKKFALADSLAIFALNGENFGQVQGAGWAWILLIAYSFRIYFDFSGYTDIAIGLGRLLGFKLPENFNRPYLKENLTLFWNSWHITLAQWFRSYYFNPLARWARTQKPDVPVPAVMFAAQITTMMLIGLWHGVTVNFLIWGVWHGVGLFVHSRWAEWRRSRENNNPPIQSTMVSRWVRIGITYLYVTLGWVWFALPDFGQAVLFIQKLFGGTA